MIRIRNTSRLRVRFKITAELAELSESQGGSADSACSAVNSEHPCQAAAARLPPRTSASGERGRTLVEKRGDGVLEILTCIARRDQVVDPRLVDPPAGLNAADRLLGGANRQRSIADNGGHQFARGLFDRARLSHSRDETKGL